MQQLADGVWRLSERPAPVINVYLAGDVLIDAGRRWDRRRIFNQLEGKEISLLALTHVHPDHQGVAKDVCEARGIPLACHEDDVDAMEGRRPVSAGADLASRLRTVERRLKAVFTVVLFIILVTITLVQHLYFRKRVTYDLT